MTANMFKTTKVLTVPSSSVHVYKNSDDYFDHAEAVSNISSISILDATASVRLTEAQFNKIKGTKELFVELTQSQINSLRRIDCEAEKQMFVRIESKRKTCLKFVSDENFGFSDVGFSINLYYLKPADEKRIATEKLAQATEYNR